MITALGPGLLGVGPPPDPTGNLLGVSARAGVIGSGGLTTLGLTGCMGTTGGGAGCGTRNGTEGGTATSTGPVPEGITGPDWTEVGDDGLASGSNCSMTNGSTSTVVAPGDLFLRCEDDT